MRRALLLAAVLLTALPGAAAAGVANAGLPGASRSNPLAGMPWGNYDGPLDEVYPPYRSASGMDRTLLGYIAGGPRMRWFGGWYPDPRGAAQAYIENITAGDPNALAQIAVFRLDPWEGQAAHQLPTRAQQASFRSWIDGFAAGIGSSRVALVLQPDLPVELTVLHHSQIPLRLVAYAARAFSALPHTTVYIDAGASDWASVSQAASLLRSAGVKFTRGFALGATHYASTPDEVRFGAQVAEALAHDGLPGKRFVVNTAQNGRGFTYQQYGHPSSYDNATVCTSRHQRRCVTLGIPPTTDVANHRWRLPSDVERLAAQYEDADLWIGRPWLYYQGDFGGRTADVPRALMLARTWPFAP